MLDRLVLSDRPSEHDALLGILRRLGERTPAEADRLSRPAAQGVDAAPALPRGSAVASPVPAPSPGPAATTGGQAAPSLPDAAPQVLIDRIEVVTPAARPPAPDPFQSLGARRVGASRHGATG
jgi:hypothetical protein